MKTLLVLYEGAVGLAAMLGSVRASAGPSWMPEASQSEDRIPGAHRINLEELTQWTDRAHKALVF
jgi:hypothetical protein